MYIDVMYGPDFRNFKTFEKIIISKLYTLEQWFPHKRRGFSSYPDK